MIQQLLLFGYCTLICFSVSSLGGGEGGEGTSLEDDDGDAF